VPVSFFLFLSKGWGGVRGGRGGKNRRKMERAMQQLIEVGVRRVDGGSRD
jgi:hypothetical protein